MGFPGGRFSIGFLTVIPCFEVFLGGGSGMVHGSC